MNVGLKCKTKRLKMKLLKFINDIYWLNNLMLKIQYINYKIEDFSTKAMM